MESALEVSVLVYHYPDEILMKRNSLFSMDAVPFPPTFNIPKMCDLMLSMEGIDSYEEDKLLINKVVNQTVQLGYAFKLHATDYLKLVESTWRTAPIDHLLMVEPGTWDPENPKSYSLNALDVELIEAFSEYVMK